MIQPHQRAAMIPNEPGVSWRNFLGGRFIGPLSNAGRDASLAMAAQSFEQKSPEVAEVRGLLEYSSGSSLPVVFEFVGALNLETREISVQQTQPDKSYAGQISENGRVIVLRQSGQSKPIHLVHEETLEQLI